MKYKVEGTLTMIGEAQNPQAAEDQVMDLVEEQIYSQDDWYFKVTNVTEAEAS